MLLYVVFLMCRGWMSLLQLLYPSSVEAEIVDEAGNVIEQPRPRHDDDDDEDVESLTGTLHAGCKFCASSYDMCLVLSNALTHHTVGWVTEGRLACKVT